MPRQHTVKAGECIASIAFENGLAPDTLWNDPANAELRKRRADPSMLLAQDVITIPDKREGEAIGATGSTHTFRRKGVPARFRLQVFDVEEPRANQKYTLMVDGRRFEGAADDAGVVEEWIPPDAVEGELTIGPDDFKIEIQFGHLDPIDEVPGVQKRLSNLGYYSGPANGQMDEDTTEALMKFQTRFGLDPTGELDDQTRTKLSDAHDSCAEFPDQSS